MNLVWRYHVGSGSCLARPTDRQHGVWGCWAQGRIIWVYANSIHVTWRKSSERIRGCWAPSCTMIAFSTIHGLAPLNSPHWSWGPWKCGTWLCCLLHLVHYLRPLLVEYVSSNSSPIPLDVVAGFSLGLFPAGRLARQVVFAVGRLFFHIAELIRCSWLAIGPEMAMWIEVIRVISAIFLRETLEAANNDAEMLVQDLRQTCSFFR